MALPSSASLLVPGSSPGFEASHLLTMQATGPAPSSAGPGLPQGVVLGGLGVRLGGGSCLYLHYWRDLLWKGWILAPAGPAFPVVRLSWLSPEVQRGREKHLGPSAKYKAASGPSTTSPASSLLSISLCCFLQRVFYKQTNEQTNKAISFTWIIFGLQK